jgi:hypothetical protein
VIWLSRGMRGHPTIFIYIIIIIIIIDKNINKDIIDQHIPRRLPYAIFCSRMSLPEPIPKKGRGMRPNPSELDYR